MSVRLAETRFEGLPALEAGDGRLRLIVVPAWGGKIASLYDVDRGREWLYKSPTVAWRLPTYGADYIRDFDVGGFDECFPSVAPCRYPQAPWEGVPVPDHGEVWSLPWAVSVDGDSIRLSVQGVRLPYRLEKTIHLLGGGRVRLAYRLIKLAPFDMPFVWSSHPLFALQPGMRVHLPVSAVRVDLAARFQAAHGDRLAWPVTANGLDLSLVPAASAGWAIKVFTEVGAEGWAALTDPQAGASLRFDFDPTRITHLGLWLNYGGWAGSPGAAPYYNLALEPCIGAPDALDTAVRHWRAHGVAPANGECTWGLEVQVGVE